MTWFSAVQKAFDTACDTLAGVVLLTRWPQRCRMIVSGEG
jgi:hypothetical protein